MCIFFFGPIYRLRNKYIEFWGADTTFVNVEPYQYIIQLLCV